MNPFTKGFKEYREGSKRFIKCGICGASIPKSIVPHMKSCHAKEWCKWVDRFLDMRSKGASFKDIMWDFGRLFSWSVIRKEIFFDDPMLFKDTEIRDWLPKDFRLEESTLWRFPTRGEWANHTHHYPGNWAPQIPRNLMLRYSSIGDTLLDPFMGSGTTLIECMLLARNGYGVDISQRAVKIAELRIAELKRVARRQKYPLHETTITIRQGDARNLDFIDDKSIDLVCAHPPYMDSIKYTKWLYEDLSRISNPQEYMKEVSKVARELHRVLKDHGFCAVMIGDVRKNCQLIPLGFDLFQAFSDEGFRIHEIVARLKKSVPSTSFTEVRIMVS